MITKHTVKCIIYKNATTKQIISFFRYRITLLLFIYYDFFFMVILASSREQIAIDLYGKIGEQEGEADASYQLTVGYQHQN